MSIVHQAAAIGDVSQTLTAGAARSSVGALLQNSHTDSGNRTGRDSRQIRRDRRDFRDAQQQRDVV